jgi:hypothetical protein
MYSNPLFEVASEIQTKQKWSISLSDVYCWLDTIARKLLTAQNGRRVCNDIYTSYITESKIDRRDLAAALLDLCDAADSTTNACAGSQSCRGCGIGDLR